MEDLDKELSHLKEVEDQAYKAYQKALNAFIAQRDRVNENIDFWHMYNCILDYNQAYEGSISRIFVPIVHDAVEARVTRFTNQIFPTNGRYVEVITEDGTFPYAHMALIEHYVNVTKLRTEIIPALMRNGDIEGQYNISVTWRKKNRKHRYRALEKPVIDNMEIDMEGLEDIETIKEQEWEEGYPDVEVLADSDVVVWPLNAKSVEDAIENGGGCARLMRMSKEKVQAMADQGEFTQKQADMLASGFANHGANQAGYDAKDVEEAQAEAAGIHKENNTQVAYVYQVWTKIKVNGERKLCRIYFGGERNLLSVKRNPYWCDKCPIISVPVRKMPGAFKGQQPVKSVANLQYMANDAANLGLSSGIYSLMPIVMTDPEKNPRIGSMMMNVAAIWQTSPADTQVVSFPDLYQKGLEMVDWCKAQVFQALGVNPSMVTQGGAYRRPTQAEVANEQMVDVLTTADAVTIIEGGILNEVIDRFYHYDRQFRTTEMAIEAFGEGGISRSMEVIEPIQEDNRYKLKWFGVEQARTAQQIQMQTSAINVIRGIPPQLLNGKKLDMGPFVERLSENAFGPRLGPRVLVDERNKLAMSPELENDMYAQGMAPPINELDNDVAHIQSHIDHLNSFGDVTGHLRIHIEEHQKQLLEKQQQFNMATAQANPSSAPAGGAAMPMPGSSPAGTSNMKAPAGTIQEDQLVDPSIMPRGRPV